MKTHIIENGVIVNTIMATVEQALYAYPDAICIDATLGGAIGDGYDEASGTVVPAPAPPAVTIVPEQITCGQGREALYNVGLFANVQPAIDAIDDPDTKWRVQNAWDYRPTWERQSPFVEMMAGILGLSAEQADQLFITAAAL